MNYKLTISRMFHDFILAREPYELEKMYDLHKVTWTIAGPTFHDVGAWYRAFVESEHMEFLKQREGQHLVVRSKL